MVVNRNRDFEPLTASSPSLLCVALLEALFTAQECRDDACVLQRCMEGELPFPAVDREAILGLTHGVQHARGKRSFKGSP